MKNNFKKQFTFCESQTLTVGQQAGNQTWNAMNVTSMTTAAHTEHVFLQDLL